jgi:hypothetical protein
LSIIDNFEAITEVRPLLPHEIELKSQSNAQIARLLRKEEIKWYQLSKCQFILEGDANTRYFHSVANGRHRKKLIHSLTQYEGTIEGHEELNLYITNYYKGVFGDPEEGNFLMDESRTNDIPQVSDEENNLLMSHRTCWETPRGRYDKHSSKFSLGMKPKFNRSVGERNHF